MARGTAERTLATERRGARPNGQAPGTAWICCLFVILAMPGCGDARLAALDPRPFANNVMGAHLEGRLPPPRADDPWPNLAGVPPRPEVPSPAARDALTQALARDRTAAATPLPPGSPGTALPPTPGLAPPPPPSLAAAPPIALVPLAADAAPDPARAAAAPPPPPPAALRAPRLP